MGQPLFSYKTAQVMYENERIALYFKQVFVCKCLEEKVLLCMVRELMDLTCEGAYKSNFYSTAQ